MINLNEKEAQFFLEENGYKNCAIKKIAGDASFRSYYRIFDQEKTFILMFAPPSHEETAPFIAIDEFLVQHNFSAPKILARNIQKGFLLLEDFGDESYSKVLANFSNQQKIIKEFELYQKASDCLVELHKIKPLKNLPTYNHALLFREVMLFIDWYLPLQKIKISQEEIASFKYLWFKLFDLLDKENQVVVLRDYHADNLMFIDSRSNYQQVGLLDFQDAVIGSKAYDLVSMLEDARRDLEEENRIKILNYYLEKSKSNKDNLLTDYKVLSLQRNIKIVGIFARLSARDQKNQYLEFLPRVLTFVKNRLNNDDIIFYEMRKLLEKFI
jgi:hypothetical protein